MFKHRNRRILAALLSAMSFVVLSPVSVAEAKASVNLDQCANLGITCDTANPGQWINGNLGSSKSLYTEGDSVPYRVTLDGLTVGTTYAVTLQWGDTKGGHNALDYLTDYDFSEATADPCAGLACGGTTSTLPIPIDPHVGAIQATGQSITVFGGTFPASGATVPNSGDLCVGPTCTISQNPSAYGLIGDYATDAERTTTVYFTADSTLAVLAWGGHIASSIDWGIGNSASMISGSPYHMAVNEFDCSDDACNAGAQDRSLSSEAVISPASITVVKQASPEGSTSFDFTASPAPLSNFSLVDDGTVSNTRTFSGITTFTDYTITEQSLPYWDLTGVVCDVLSPNGGSRTITDGQVVIDLREGENVTCTYSNLDTYAPAMSLAKSASPSTYSDVGQSITYTYTITNTGNAPIGPDQFTITDDKVNGGVPFNCGAPAVTIAVAGTLTCTATHTVTAADVTAGSVTNTAFASGGGLTTSTVQATVTYAHLAIAKAASPSRFVSAGETITYTYTLTNNGNTPLGPTQFTVDDDKIDGGAPFNCGAAGITLAIGATVTCTATYTVNAADVTAGYVTNNAFGSGAGLVTPTVSTTVTYAHLGISKVPSPARYDSAGDVITYTYTLANTGNTILGPAQFTIDDDKINGGVPFNCGAADTTIDILDAITCTATYTVTSADVVAGSVTNHAFGAGDGLTTNTVQSTVTYAELSIAKSADPARYMEAGDVIIYTYVITNTGDTPLGPTQFTVDDDKINGGAPFNCGAAGITLAIGGTVTCTASYTVTAADVTAGHVTNTAFAVGDGLTSGTAQTTVTYAALDLAKAASPVRYTAAGEVITYTYTFTNNGDTPLGPTQFTVDDDKINGGAPFNCGASDITLAPDATLTCTKDYVVTAADVTAGYVTNVAFGAGDGITTDDATTTVTYAALSIDKSAEPTTFTVVGETITYTYTLTNSGNTILGPTQFTVTDDKINGGAPFNCGPASTTLAIGASITCTKDYVITAGDVEGGFVTNSAHGHGDGLATSTVTTTVTFKELSISKSASPATYDEVGDVITYTYVITNSGDTPLGPTQFTVDDDKINGGTPFNCGPADTTLAIGATVTCTATHSITLADVTAGSLTNTAFGAGAGLTTPSVQTTVTYAQLSIDKAASPTRYTEAGDVITYTYTLTNSGNTVLGPTQFRVDDDKINGGAPFNCGPADTTLAIGATVTCTAIYTITAADITAGSVTNTAFGAGDGLATGTVSTTMTYAELSIAKSASPNRYKQAGDAIIYTYVLTNSGDTPLGPTQFMVDDDKINGGAPFNCGPAASTLAVGATLTCTATYTITAADVTAGSVTNTAFGTGDGLTTGMADTTVTYAHLSIAKSASPMRYEAAGDVITYTYTLTNSGNTPLGPDQFMITDDKINDGVAFNCDGADVTLAVGGTMTCTRNYVITTADVAAGYVTNTAFAAGDGLTTNDVSTTVKYADLSIAKSAAPTRYETAGDVITYTYTLTNSGNTPLGPTQFMVDDDKINGGAPFNCGPAATTLAIDGTVTCTATYTVTAADITAGSVTNAAFGSGDGLTTSTVETTVTYAELSIAKSASPTRYEAAGDVITYTYTLTNSGNSPLGPTQFMVDDDKINGGAPFNCGPAASTLAVGAMLTCTASYTVTVADVTAGSVTNVAFATGDGLTSGTASTTVTYAELSIVKSAAPSTYKHVGDVVTYTYVLTNSGDTPLGPTQFKVDDDKINGGAPFNCGAAGTTLAAGASLTCIKDYVVTAADITAGSVTNVAFGAGDGLTTSDVTTTVTYAALSIAKSASPTMYTKTGDVIIYAYTLTNSGNTPLGPTQFKVDDDKINGGAPFNCGSSDAILAVGATLTCTASYTITDADVAAGSVTNAAFGTGGGLITGTVTSTVTYGALGISKSASPSTYTKVGDVITYTYVLTNTGDMPLGPTQFTVDDDKINGGAPFNCGPAASTLAIGATLTCTTNYTITAADVAAGSVTNAAFGSGGGVTTPTVTSTVTYVPTPTTTAPPEFIDILPATGAGPDGPLLSAILALLAMGAVILGGRHLRRRS